MDAVEGVAFDLESPVNEADLGVEVGYAPADFGVGVEPGIGFHATRHFYASLLIQSGASVKVVQKRLGHASAIDTLDTYGHLWPDTEDETRSAVDKAFATLAGQPRDELTAEG